MSKESIPLVIGDISGFARLLAQNLQGREVAPSHLTLLNMLARAAGFRNHQHLKAAHGARARLDKARPVRTVDYRLVERVLHQFDAAGRLMRWPSKRSVQKVCLWTLWAGFPAATTWHERDVNRMLQAAHLFGDPALLRRDMVMMGLMSRNPDGSDYRRLEKRPPPEALEVIERIKARRADWTAQRDAA